LLDIRLFHPQEKGDMLLFQRKFRRQAFPPTRSCFSPAARPAACPPFFPVSGFRILSSALPFPVPPILPLRPLRTLRLNHVWTRRYALPRLFLCQMRDFPSPAIARLGGQRRAAIKNAVPQALRHSGTQALAVPCCFFVRCEIPPPNATYVRPGEVIHIKVCT